MDNPRGRLSERCVINEFASRRGNSLYLICYECGKSLGLKHYPIRPDGLYPSVCFSCVQNAQAQKQAKAMAARKEENLLKKEERAVRQHNARMRVTQKAVRRKEKKQRYSATAELAARELARRSLLAFTRRFHPKYKAGWAHKDLCTRLERFLKAVEEGKMPRLMISMPPRSGKTTLASKMFPAWVLGHHPDWEIIAASYGVSLPVGFSRVVRRILKDPAYKVVFPRTKVDEEAQATTGWLTTQQGGYLPAGVMGPITGRGAHCLILDDLVKDSLEADSEVQRDRVWDWWGSVAKTRLSPGGGAIYIGTRWHDDDISGRLLAQEKQQTKEFEERIEAAEDEEIKSSLREELSEIDHWEVVRYAAIAVHDEWLGKDGTLSDTETPGAKFIRHKGEALHPDRFPLPILRNYKNTMQPRHWSAQYQQNPVPEEGSFFRATMFRTESSFDPRDCAIYAAWDLAISKQQQRDYTVGVIGAMDSAGVLHILDVVRGRMDAMEIVDAILAQATKHSVHLVGIERGQLELAIRPHLKAQMRAKRVIPAFDNTLVPITDKLSRARPLQGLMQQGMIVFPTGQEWVDELKGELLRFPAGVHDDQVDAMAWLVRMALKQPLPRQAKAKQHKSWKDKLSIGGRKRSWQGG